MLLCVAYAIIAAPHLLLYVATIELFPFPIDVVALVGFLFIHPGYNLWSFFVLVVLLIFCAILAFVGDRRLQASLDRPTIYLYILLVFWLIMASLRFALASANPQFEPIIGLVFLRATDAVSILGLILVIALCSHFTAGQARDGADLTAPTER